MNTHKFVIKQDKNKKPDDLVSTKICPFSENYISKVTRKNKFDTD